MEYFSLEIVKGTPHWEKWEGVASQTEGSFEKCLRASQVLICQHAFWIYQNRYSVIIFMAPHSSTPAWKIPWTEEPGRLQSMGLLSVGHDWATSLSLFTFTHWRRKWQPTPVFLPWRIPGTREPGRLQSMGSHRVGHNWSDLAAAAAAGYSLENAAEPWMDLW